MGNNCTNEATTAGAHEFHPTRPGNHDLNIGCVGCFPNPHTGPITVDYAELLTHNNEMIPMGKISMVSIAFLQKDEIGFLKACAGKNVSALRHYLKKGVNVNLLDEDRTSPLHVAARSGSIQVIEELINSGASINMADMAGWTPLHVASYYQRALVCHLMMKKGADPYLMSRQGETPWDMVREKDVEEIFHIHFNRSEIRKMSNIRRDDGMEEVNENVASSQLKKMKENTFKTKRFEDMKNVDPKAQSRQPNLSFSNRVSFMEHESLRNLADTQLAYELGLPAEIRYKSGSFHERGDGPDTKQPKKHKYYLYFKKIKEEYNNNFLENKNLMRTLNSDMSSTDEAPNNKDLAVTQDHWGLSGTQSRFALRPLETGQDDLYSSKFETATFERLQANRGMTGHSRNNSGSPIKSGLKPSASHDMMKSSNHLLAYYPTNSFHQNTIPNSLTQLASVSHFDRTNMSIIPLTIHNISIYKMICKNPQEIMFTKLETESVPYFSEAEMLSDFMPYKVDPKHTDIIYKMAIELFNYNCLMGLSFCILFKFVKPEPKEIAFFLAKDEGQTTNKKSPIEITSFLTNTQIKEGFEILQNYSKFFHFERMTFIEALRNYLSNFSIDNDPEKIDWILRGFARRFFKHSKYMNKNSGTPLTKPPFQTVEALRMLAFTTVMLDIELNHSDMTDSAENVNQVKREFIANLSGINDGEDFSPTLLNNIFEEVKRAGVIKNLGYDPSSNKSNIAFKAVKLVTKVNKYTEDGIKHRKEYTYYIAGPVCFIMKHYDDMSVPKGFFMLTHCSISSPNPSNSKVVSFVPNKTKGSENVPYAKFVKNGVIFLCNKKEFTVEVEREADVQKIRAHLALL